MYVLVIWVLACTVTNGACDMPKDLFEVNRTYSARSTCERDLQSWRAANVNNRGVCIWRDK